MILRTISPSAAFRVDFNICFAAHGLDCAWNGVPNLRFVFGTQPPRHYGDRCTPQLCHLPSPFASSMVHCTGCGREFSASGYTSHVTHTKSRICHAAYINQLDSLALEEDDSDLDDDTGPQNFLGDSFGNSNDMDFGWPDSDDEQLSGM